MKEYRPLLLVACSYVLLRMGCLSYRDKRCKCAFLKHVLSCIDMHFAAALCIVPQPVSYGREEDTSSDNFRTERKDTLPVALEASFRSVLKLSDAVCHFAEPGMVLIVVFC